MINIIYKSFQDLNSKVQKRITDIQDNHMVINGQTYTLDGENISDKYKPKLDIKYTDDQINNFKSNHEMAEFQKENGGFVFLFYQVNKSMSKYTNNLTKADVTRLLYLTTYTAWETNKIQYDNGRDITDKDLTKLLRLQPRQYNDYIKRLIENNIITIDSNNNKYISEYICKNGSLNKKQLHKQDIQYTRLFKDTVRSLYESSTVREFGRLSTIYMILPYINLYTNVISHNPYENNEDKIIPMSIVELASKLGYTNYTKLKNAMYKTKFEDEYSFAFITMVNDRRKTKILVNPKIMFAGTYDMLKLLLIIFKDFNSNNK